VAGTVSLVGNEPGLGQQLEVSRNSRPADGQVIGDFLDGAFATREKLDDCSALGVA
jgi:hypothetical protein